MADALDIDFDSVPDVKTTYENNLPVRKELDLQFDSKPDVIRKYTKGQLRELKADTDGDGRFDHFELYKNGKLTQVGVTRTGMDNQTRTNGRKSRIPSKAALHSHFQTARYGHQTHAEKHAPRPSFQNAPHEYDRSGPFSAYRPRSGAEKVFSPQSAHKLIRLAFALRRLDLQGKTTLAQTGLLRFWRPPGTASCASRLLPSRQYRRVNLGSA